MSGFLLGATVARLKVVSTWSPAGRAARSLKLI